MGKDVRVWKLLSVAIVLAALCSSTAFADTDEDLYFDASLRGTDTASIHLGVYNNPKDKGDSIVLAVHGMTETASMYEPLADAIYADNVLKNKVNKIISIDAVVHGLSSAPTGLPENTTFGDLALQDNASVIIQVINYLDAIGIGPDAIMGHSMGGITVQLVQELLLAGGSSLRDLGVKRAALIASVPANGTQWTRLEVPPLPGLPNPTYSIYLHPELGLIFDNPIEYCGRNGAFTMLDGSLIPDYPTAETCEVNGWMSVEPYTTVVQLVYNRPYVQADAFKAQNGTTLMVLGFSEDILTPIVDQDILYTYLTGKGSAGPSSLYRPIVADDAVHAMYISNPSVVAYEMRKLFQ